ncbi:HK97 family phage prohead protease [Brevibacillus agri]|uniref:HK97 family phage prohead protease n=1 Tax=Brevibacillus agri TaxID=51101 RepID=UPI0018CF90A1|nr:HK97 family phage prohead protease [Brevibacillus agri]MBG9567560.1 HK97 family phage prohead protease [Brevibacillus agri]MBG9567597.1 HK97 family phage prohead protease [Brevibacillus agri]MED1642304.1 HK97 family phage prohead protease [Brevibacillus agri]MED1657715.1 HK97 family phage prohead protease [Brevibacillus agri]MED1689472.1 HK97 family phage prohead protease [Brevibacillus agri]
MSRDTRQTRSLKTELKTRAEGDGGDLTIEGYFAVFNRQTELWPGAFEEIASEAFDRTLGNDIRALIDHETRLVLGRNKAGTLELKTDSHGLWGRIKVNPNDSDAMNLYERVKRGDVDQCSFGFNIVREETDWREDGTVKWTIREIDLHEVSVVTFPAYEDTGVAARQKQVEQHRDRILRARRQKIIERVRGIAQTTVTGKKD